MNNLEDLPEVLSVLPTGDLVALPGLVIPVMVSEGPALAAINHALDHERIILVALSSFNSQEDELVEDNLSESLNSMAAWARIVSSVKLPDGELKVRLQVEGRAVIEEIVNFKPVVLAKVSYPPKKSDLKIKKAEAKCMEEVKHNLKLLGEHERGIDDYLFIANDIFHPGDLADIVASALNLSLEPALTVLEELDPNARLKLVAKQLNHQLELVSLRQQVAGKAQKELGRAQKEELLREQLEFIRSELGESNDREVELSDLEQRLVKLKLPKLAKDEAYKQLRRLKNVHPDASEAGLMRTYLEWIIELPWRKKTKDRLDLANAKNILDEDHYGLEKTKERILDFLGVRKLKRNHRGPVLLLLGPPGVGKTSLGQSIARALGRKFVRVSVGGLRDEAELRGHRRTYVGALPGRIIQGLKRAGSKNPVFMLDELDKIGSDFRGDPASVLLEVLDPEQNNNFEDHYLNIPFDLSEVMFIGTANLLDTIPAPLRDRLEVLEISGYTDREKLAIAKRYLLPRALKDNGLEKEKIICSEQALQGMIRGYTRESGVRELGRVVTAVYRKVARGLAENKTVVEKITPKFVEKALGQALYKPDQRQKKDEVGVVSGLAWTSVGGEILIIEASVTPGKGTLLLTGQQGAVMQESARAALTFVNSNAQNFGIDPEVFEQVSIHVHLPQGAIPKDGPSAGIAIATAIVSVLTGVAVSRDIAMTGEITLRGNVLEIGGLKEKSLAAHRMGINRVLIPIENQRDLKEFPEHLLAAVEFIAVENASEVLAHALVEKIPTKKTYYPVGAKVLKPKPVGKTPPKGSSGSKKGRVKPVSRKHPN